MSLAEPVSNIGSPTDDQRDCIGNCPEVPEWCGDECSEHDAEHCQVSAEVLQECTERCREMTNA